MGESARSLCERAEEHVEAYQNKLEDSHMFKHQQLDHKEDLVPPTFKFQLVGTFPDAFTRQIAEAIRVEHKGGRVLNSKGIYNRCNLPRLVVNMNGQEDRGLVREHDDKVEDKSLTAGGKDDSAYVGLDIKKRNRDSVSGKERKNRKRRKILVDNSVEWGTKEKSQMAPFGCITNGVFGVGQNNTRQSKIRMVPWCKVMVGDIVKEILENVVGVPSCPIMEACTIPCEEHLKVDKEI